MACNMKRRRRDGSILNHREFTSVRTDTTPKRPCSGLLATRVYILTLLQTQISGGRNPESIDMSIPAPDTSVMEKLM